MNHPTAPQTRRRAAAPATTILLVIGMLAACAATASPTTAALPGRRAHIASTMSATDTAHLHYLRNSGSLLFEEGSVTGTLPGRMRASIDIAPTATGNFTFYTRNGTINGRGSAKMHGSGLYESFAGTLSVNGGTSRYMHAHGRAGLYGTFDRRTYALIVQTTGSLTY
jgi:hypothetical protein